jgi:hypothetical protein
MHAGSVLGSGEAECLQQKMAAVEERTATQTSVLQSHHLPAQCRQIGAELIRISRPTVLCPTSGEHTFRSNQHFTPNRKVYGLRGDSSEKAGAARVDLCPSLLYRGGRKFRLRHEHCLQASVARHLAFPYAPPHGAVSVSRIVPPKFLQAPSVGSPCLG